MSDRRDATPKARASADKGSVRSGRGRVRRVIVVGSGAAGLMTALELCRRRVPVLLVTHGPAARAASAWSKSGLNACAGIEDDHNALYLRETLACGSFMAQQPPVNAMIEKAPSLLDELVRMGVPFDRSPEGSCSRVRMPGSTRARTALCGMATGLFAVGALDEQLRRLETLDLSDERGLSVPGERMLQRLEGWDFVRLVLDDNGVVVGIVAQELRTMKIRALPADAVCLATGSASGLFARSTAGTESSGAAAGAAYLQGAVWANGEFVQFHPTTFLTADKARPIPESVRAAGGRLWVPKNPDDTRHPHDIPDRERDYFLDRMYPRFAELVPADLATRAIAELYARGRGLNDSGSAKGDVYLDISELDQRSVEQLFGPLLEAYVKLTGDHPLARPMRVGPAVHATLGGLWVDYEAGSNGLLVEESARNQATSLSGLYAAGDVEYQYHGACRLDGNALLARVFAGRTAGAAMTMHRRALLRSAFDLPSSLFEKAENAEQASFDEIIGRAGGTGRNPFELVRELSEALFEACGPEGSDQARDRLLELLDELALHAEEASISDATSSMNRSALLARKLEAELAVARVIGASTKRRAEARALDRDDRTRLTTLARHRAPGQVEFVQELEYRAAGRAVKVTDRVDTSLVAPGSRGYDEK